MFDPKLVKDLQAGVKSICPICKEKEGLMYWRFAMPSSTKDGQLRDSISGNIKETFVCGDCAAKLRDAQDTGGIVIETKD